MGVFISVVSPVYRAEKILEKLVLEIQKVMKKMDVTFEIVLVDDRSPDNSWHVMKELKEKYSFLKIYRFSRNFGQHPAIMAGLTKTNAEWIVVMDCDLQDQPKEIEKLLAKATEGYDIVQARRVNRKDSFFKKLGSRLFSIFFNYLSDIKVNHEIANFGIYHKKVIKEVVNMGDYIKSFPLFVYFVGFNSYALEIEHAERDSGKSNYTLSKLLDLAFTSIIAYSNKPLKLFVKLGVIISLISFIIGGYYITQAISGGVVVPGYASLIVSLFFLSGIIICAIGIVGVYLGRVFEQIKNRPSFIIEEEFN
ncbi:MAG: glycosyltransferase family 2 protein [Chitinophagaceae bacterium]|nr:glycosyltransferase family 2 protein [Chitinophagaceae bacterium]